MTTEYKWVGNHLQDLTGGRMMEPGEVVELTDEEISDPFNAALIAGGQMLLLPDQDTEKVSTRHRAAAHREES